MHMPDFGLTIAPVGGLSEQRGSPRKCHIVSPAGTGAASAGLLFPDVGIQIGILSGIRVALISHRRFDLFNMPKRLPNRVADKFGSLSRSPGRNVFQLCKHLIVEFNY